jgi:hypothetical protein
MCGPPSPGAVVEHVVGHRLDPLPSGVDNRQPQSRRGEDAREHRHRDVSAALKSRHARLRDVDTVGELALAEVGKPPRTTNVPRGVELIGRSATGIDMTHRRVGVGVRVSGRAAIIQSHGGILVVATDIVASISLAPHTPAFAHVLIRHSYQDVRRWPAWRRSPVDKPR